ncbi:MAG: undecaprenyl-diphosphatase UppP [bacterium]
MDILYSAILGTVEGLTEFIPISSTGHLIIARSLLGLPQESGLAFDAIIQLAAACAVVVYFRKDIWRLIKSFIALITRKFCSNEDRIMVYGIIIGTIPAVVLGLLLEKTMETVFRSPYYVAVGLILGSVLFIIAEKLSKQNQTLTIKKGLQAGFYQCLALFPGMSRSGSTIAGGLLLGLTRESAVRFSFLLSLPIIFGSGAKKVLDVVKGGQLAGIETSLLIGSVFAFVFGLLAISFLIKFLKTNTLKSFAVYRVVLTVVVVILLLTSVIK